MTSILEDIFGGHRNPSTKVSTIEEFVRNLNRYEETVIPNSGTFSDYRGPAHHLKDALRTIVVSDPADTYSMMRRLVEHVSAKIETCYNDFTINMLASSTHDQEARNLIMGIVYNLCELIKGENVELGASWHQLVHGNMAILTFFENYQRSDLVVDETYSGEAVLRARNTIMFHPEDESVEVRIEYANYDILLKAHEEQTVSFTAHPELRNQMGVGEADKLVVSTEVILTTGLCKLTLDRNLGFFDDAKAQMNALRCIREEYTPGEDIPIELPGLFYSLLLKLVSYDGGENWRAAEVQILPPSRSRSW